MKGNTFKQLTTCKSLHELETDDRGGSRTAKTSGMELLIEIVNSFCQWTIVTKFSVLDVETVPLKHTGLDDKYFQLSASPFLKVDSKKDYFLMSCQFYLVLFHCIYLLLSFLMRIDKLLIEKKKFFFWSLFTLFLFYLGSDSRQHASTL